MDAATSDRELLVETYGLVQQINTRLTIVCGEDGNGGRLEQQGKRIESLERTRTEQRARKHLLMTGWTGLCAALVWLIDHWHLVIRGGR